MAELHVSKKSISKLFSEMQNRKFIIPDFQRPYKWNVESAKHYGMILKISLLPMQK
jgi:hypothetical protein